MRHRDSAHVARLHRAALPPSFFSRLGEPFLRTYYGSFVDSPHGIALVATRDSEVCGFVVGTAATGDHAAWTLRHRGLRLALVGAAALLVQPRLALWFVRTRGARYVRGIYRRLTHRVSSPTAGGTRRQPAVLAHIAVDDTQRGSGVGALLVAAFERELAPHGVRSFELVTLHGPAGAGHFYERLGFEMLGMRTDEDGKSWRYYRSGPAAD